MTKERITGIGRLRQIVLLSCKSAFLRFTKLASVFLFSGLALNSNVLAMPNGTSDAELVEQLKGFENASITTPDGIRIHYVEGGQGEPLILLPGWPETWWEYHKIMPVLATHFHVIAVDIRGMAYFIKPGNDASHAWPPPTHILYATERSLPASSVWADYFPHVFRDLLPFAVAISGAAMGESKSEA